MNAYNFDPSDNPTMREIERMNRIANPFEDMARKLDPLGEMARKLNPLEHMAAKIDPIGARVAETLSPTTRHLEEIERVNRIMKPYDQIDRVVNPLKHMAAELNPFEDMARKLNPFDHGQQATSAFDSLMADQEALSRRVKELTAPSPEIPSQDWMSRLGNMRVPVERFNLDLPEIHFPESRSLAELQRMSDDEIRALLNGDVSINTVQMASRVLAMRHLERATRPHWSVIPMFWLVVASVIIGAIGIIIGATGIYLMLR